MRFSIKHSISKAAALLGLLGAAFVQTGCAHPVMVEPSVVIQSRIAYPQVYGPQVVSSIGYYPQVVVRPSVVYPPPVAPIYMPQPIRFQSYGYGQPRLAWGGHERGGHHRHDGGRGGWGYQR